MFESEAILWSVPEAERFDRPLLVLLHGYGAAEDDLFGLAPWLPAAYVLAAPRAPVRQGRGFSWFPMPDEGADPSSAEVDPVADVLVEWISSMSGDASSVGVLGFSQGGAMGLQLLRRKPDAVAFVVTLSGFLAVGEQTADAALEAARVPVFWGRGGRDDVIRDRDVTRLAAYLPRHSDLIERIYDDLGHAVSAAELEDVAAFLRAQLR